MKLFILKDGSLILNTDEIALVKEFAAILRRDKNHKKEHAFAEFNYIYQICDKNSYCQQRGLSDKEAHATAIDLAGLAVTYQPDDLVLSAIRRYVQMRPSQLELLAAEIRGSFNVAHKVIRALRIKISDYIDKEDLNPEDLQNATAALDKLLHLSETVPKKIRSLKEIENLIEEEDKGSESLRGGGDILDSMNPDTAIG